jgi:hypothetical protein
MWEFEEEEMEEEAEAEGGVEEMGGNGTGNGWWEVESAGGGNGETGTEVVYDVYKQQPFNGRTRPQSFLEVMAELEQLAEAKEKEDLTSEDVELEEAMGRESPEVAAALAEAEANFINELRQKAPSKMTVSELRTELDSYSLPSKGLRKDVYRRIQVCARMSQVDA